MVIDDVKRQAKRYVQEIRSIEGSADTFGPYYRGALCATLNILGINNFGHEATYENIIKMIDDAE